MRMHQKFPAPRRLTALTAALASLLLVVGLAPAAHAGRSGVSDPRGDASARGQSYATDITRVVVVHRRYKVKVKVRARSWIHTVLLRYDINRAGRYNFEGYFQDEGLGDDGHIFITGRNGSTKCHRPVRFRDNHRLFIATIPRWCLGRPRRVRARAKVYANLQDMAIVGNHRPQDVTRYTGWARRG